MYSNSSTSVYYRLESLTKEHCHSVHGINLPNLTLYCEHTFLRSNIPIIMIQEENDPYFHCVTGWSCVLFDLFRQRSIHGFSHFWSCVPFNCVFISALVWTCTTRTRTRAWWLERQTRRSWRRHSCPGTVINH